VADGGKREEVVEAYSAIYLSQVSLRCSGGDDGRDSTRSQPITFGQWATGMADTLESEELIPNHRFI
jgi:hypothetical protein